MRWLRSRAPGGSGRRDVEDELRRARDEAAAYEACAEALREREAQLAGANAAVADANQLKIDLMTMLTHEINQPLFAITGYADLLAHDWDDLDDHRRRTYVDRLDRASRPW